MRQLCIFFHLFAFILFFGLSKNAWSRGIELNLALHQSILKVPHPVQMQLNQHLIIVSNENANILIANKILSGKFDIAILPLDQSLNTFWNQKDTQLIGKIASEFIYFITDRNQLKINQNWFKNKKILLLQNSAEEYFIDQFSNNIKYQKIYSTTQEKHRSIVDNLKMNNAKIDGIAISSEQYNTNLIDKKKFNIFKIPAGDRYVISQRSVKDAFKQIEVLLAFKHLGLEIKPLKNEDFLLIQKVNKFLHKKLLSNDIKSVIADAKMQAEIIGALQSKY